MPIKNNKDEFVLFRYYPKYLKNPKFKSLISDNNLICNELDLNYIYSDIVLDGESIVHTGELYFISSRADVVASN